MLVCAELYDDWWGNTLGMSSPKSNVSNLPGRTSVRYIARAPPTKLSQYPSLEPLRLDSGIKKASTHFLS